MKQEEPLFEGDEDIKIASPLKKPKADPRQEGEEILEQLHEAGEEGRLACTKALGRDVAEKIYRCEREFSITSETDRSLLYQCRLLLLFSVTVASERYMPNTILARTLINSCYEEIERLCPEIFSGDGDYSTALSFYYLAVRGADDVEQEIGRTFAVVCEKPGDREVEKLGTTLFERCTEYIRKNSAKCIE